MAAVMRNETEVIVLDSDDEGSSSSDSSTNIYQPSSISKVTPALVTSTSNIPIINPKRSANISINSKQLPNGSVGHATVSIVNEKPLDLSLFFGKNDDSKSKETSPVIDGLIGEPTTILANSKQSLAMKSNYCLSASTRNINNINGESINSRKRTSDVSKAITKKAKVQPSQNFVKKSITKSAYPYSNVTYYFTEPPQHYDTTSDEFQGQFRCTALNCSKLLSNNVSFMYHLWAHVATFLRRDYSDDPNQLTDEKFLRTCDNCQTIFDTVFEKVKHYMEVHRGVFAVPQSKFCHSCELADYPNHPHKALHKSFEMPFECKKCRFRTSSRQALIIHFSKIHVGTTWLMCPFCPYTTTVSQHEKTKPIVFAKIFVQHMLNHGNVVAQKCSCCSYKFIDTDRFESHSRNHALDKHPYGINQKSFEDLKQEASCTKIRMEQLIRIQCRECKCQFLKAEDHFIDKKKCKRCKFETNCPNTYWKHCHLSECNPNNLTRKRFYADPKLPVKKPKISKEERKKLWVCRSKEFKDNFGIERDFDYDCKPKLSKKLLENKNKGKFEQKISKLITARKYDELTSHHQQMLKKNLMYKESKESIDFIKKLRVPFSPIYEIFLNAKKTEEGNAGDDLEKQVVN